MIDELLDLKNIPKLPQRQDSTMDQLRDLMDVAVHLGMYDAADIVRNIIVVNNSRKWKRLSEFGNY